MRASTGPSTSASPRLIPAHNRPAATPATAGLTAINAFPITAARQLARTLAPFPIRRVSSAAPSLAITRPVKKTVPPSAPTAASEMSSSSAIAAAAGPMSPEFHAVAAPSSAKPIR